MISALDYYQSISICRVKTAIATTMTTTINNNLESTIDHNKLVHASLSCDVTNSLLQGGPTGFDIIFMGIMLHISIWYLFSGPSFYSGRDLLLNS